MESGIRVHEFFKVPKIQSLHTTEMDFFPKVFHINGFYPKRKQVLYTMSISQ